MTLNLLLTIIKKISVYNANILKKIMNNKHGYKDFWYICNNNKNKKKK